ncbi:MAG: ImmA/IrrE family metallo-endopeptidase [Candidatus Hydrogenedentota bacterium]
MERIQQINPERIRWCCKDRGIAIAELAGQLDIPLQRLEMVMAGNGGLTFNQLRKVAGYFNRGVLFFLEPGSVNEQRVRSPQFRTLMNRKPDLPPDLKALIERVEMHRDIYLKLREDLDDDSPAFEPPAIPLEDPPGAAEAARDWLGLGEKNTFDTYRQAVEAKGILVFQSVGYFGAWRIPPGNPVAGFSLYDDACPVIVVKKQSHVARQSFTLMHELGHILLHRSSFIDEEHDMYVRRGREQTANAFAGRVLVPDAFLQRVSDSDRPDDVALFDDWLRPFRKQWGVSSEVILRRLLEVGRLEQQAYEAYRAWWHEQPLLGHKGGSRQHRAREPLHVFGGRFVRTVLDALHAQQISLNKASKYLDNLKIKDVHKLEAHVKGV